MSASDVENMALGRLIASRNEMNAEIDRRTYERENIPGAVQLLREFLNWYGWMERQGHDDESREELERLVSDAQRLVKEARK